MLTKYILGTAGLVFLVLAFVRMARSGPAHPQARTWPLVGVIFSVVSAFLFFNS